MRRRTLLLFPAQQIRSVAPLSLTDLERLYLLERAATTAPWKADTVQHAGENWMIGSIINTGSGEYADHIVSTDNIRASQVDSGDAKSDAEFIAAMRNAAPKLIEAAANWLKHQASQNDTEKKTDSTSYSRVSRIQEEKR